MHDKTALFYLYQADPSSDRFLAITTHPLDELQVGSRIQPCVLDYRLIDTVHALLDTSFREIVTYFNNQVPLNTGRKPLGQSDVLVREVDGQLTIYWIDNPKRLKDFTPEDFRMRLIDDFFKIPKLCDNAYRQGYDQAIIDINKPMHAIIPGEYEHTVCPRCSKDFSDIEENFDGVPDRVTGMERCPYCGQKLDWD